MIQLFCAYTGLLNAISFFFITLFILFRQKNHIQRTFCVWTFFVTWWSFVYFLWLFSNTSDEALFRSRVLAVGYIMIPATFFHFVLAYLNIDQTRTHKIFIRVGYLFAGILLLLDCTPLFVQAVERRYWFQWWPVPGPTWTLYFIYFMSLIIYAHILFYRAIQNTSGLQRKQLITIAVSTAITFTGGATNFFLWYNIPVPPVFNFLVFVHVVVMLYAILNYGLWNIRLVFRRTLVFSGLFVTAMMVLGIVTVVTQGVLSRYVPFPRSLSTALAFAIGIVIYTPIQKFLGRITYQFLFQGSSGNLRLILRQLSEELTHFIDVRELGERVLTPFQTQMPLEAGALIVKARSSQGSISRHPDPALAGEGSEILRPLHYVQGPQNDGQGGVHVPSQDYEVAAAFGLEPEAIIFESDPLIKYYEKMSDILNLQNILQTQQVPQEVTASLEHRKGVVAIPLKSHGVLSGLLILGRKKSDKEFEAYEIDMLAALGSEIAVAIRNTQLLEEIFQEREQKLKAQAQADLVQYAKTIAHEIKNAAAGIRSYGESIRDLQIPKVRGALEKADAGQASMRTSIESVLGDMVKSTEVMDRFVERIRVIAKTAEGTLSSNEGTREDIYFKLLWNEALRSAEIRDASLEVTIPENFIIRGNLVLLERVFVNLLTNSKEAMENATSEIASSASPSRNDASLRASERERSNLKPKTIYLKAEEREIDGAKVSWFEYSDSGPGIPENLIKRIFEQGFSTKRHGAPAPAFTSGHGYGLWICKKTIEEIHKGKIWVERSPHGSRFIFFLPV